MTTEQVMRIATPNEGTIIDAQMSVCAFCAVPIASIMGSPWLHADSQAADCSPDPRTEPPNTWNDEEDDA